MISEMRHCEGRQNTRMNNAKTASLRLSPTSRITRQMHKLMSQNTSLKLSTSIMNWKVIENNEKVWLNINLCFFQVMSYMTNHVYRKI